jgi:hypothetical protein
MTTTDPMISSPGTDARTRSIDSEWILVGTAMRIRVDAEHGFGATMKGLLSANVQP